MYIRNVTTDTICFLQPLQICSVFKLPLVEITLHYVCLHDDVLTTANPEFLLKKEAAAPISLINLEIVVPRCKLNAQSSSEGSTISLCLFLCVLSI